MPSQTSERVPFHAEDEGAEGKGDDGAGRNPRDACNALVNPGEEALGQRQMGDHEEDGQREAGGCPVVIGFGEHGNEGAEVEQ